MIARPTSDSKSILDAIELPEKPKRPISAYVKFMLEKRPVLLKENPSLKSTDVIKLVAEQWRALSPEEKDKFQAAIVQDKQQYQLELKSYKDKLTTEQEEALHQLKTAKRKDRSHRKVRKESKAEGKPKRPVNSYGLFVRDHASEGRSLKQLLSELKDQWENLSDVEKEKYQIEANRNWQDYETELRKWEDDRVEEGKLHLVRTKTKKSLQLLNVKVKPNKNITEQGYECLHSENYASSSEGTVPQGTGKISTVDEESYNTSKSQKASPKQQLEKAQTSETVNIPISSSTNRIIEAETTTTVETNKPATEKDSTSMLKKFRNIFKF